MWFVVFVFSPIEQGDEREETSIAVYIGIGETGSNARVHTPVF